jgi:hypothetical protein
MSNQNNQPFSPTNFSAPPEKKFPWGCLLGGCATIFLVGILAVVGSGIFGYYFVKGQVTKYTSDTPKELPTVEYPPEKVQEVTKRFETFKTTLEKGEKPEKLVLTADDINALISQNEQLRGKVFVRIENGKVSADVSLPTDAFPLGKGRFFNGSVSANASLENGVLIVTLADAEVNGEKVPEEFMGPMRKENLAKDMYKDPDVAKRLGQFESLVIEGDQIILTPKE